MEIENKYQKKYLKYKTKYENLKHGGGVATPNDLVLHCDITNRDYKLNNEYIKNAKDEALKVYQIENDDVSELLNKLYYKSNNKLTFNNQSQIIENITEQDKINQQQYFNQNEWMKKSFVVGFRLGDAIVDKKQPIFYSLEKKYFWQFESTYNYINFKGWFNNVPETNNSQEKPQIVSFTQLTSSPFNKVHPFNWSAFTQVTNTVGDAATTVGNAVDNTVIGVGESVEKVGTAIGDAASSAANTIGQNYNSFFGQTGGKTLNDLLSDPNLVNPPQIGGSEKI